MSEKVRQTLEIISDELAKPSPNSEKIGLLARSVRWQKTFDREDKTKLVEMCVRLQDHPVEDSWIVERTIFEVLCVHA